MRWRITCILFGLPLLLSAQTLSKETRARFVKDQNQYLEKLDLSLDQRRDYQTITIKYEKVFMSIYRNSSSESKKKQQVKKAQREKDIEMKRLLTQGQFKLYKKRQKDIANNYNE